LWKTDIALFNDNSATEASNILAKRVRVTDLVVVGMAYFEVFIPPHTRPAPGEELFVEGIQLALGGALNTASVAAALGLNVTLCVPMGGGIVDQAVDLLTQRLGITLMPIQASDNPAISLVFSDARDRSFVSTANLDALNFMPPLPKSRWVHVPGLEEASRLGLPLAQARKNGARISVSGSWSPQQLAQLQTRREQQWDLLVLNEKEALAACGDVSTAPQRLKGAAHSVIVTQGPNGAFGTLAGVALNVSTTPVQVVDSTGAGDAFCAGLIRALERGAEAKASLEYACSAAARILQQTGGLVTDPSTMANLKEKI
jgi:sugar/nucleoside kinase (ribokinase family)